MPLEIMSGRPIVQISAGSLFFILYLIFSGENHSVALSISGNVYSWGSNKVLDLSIV